MQIMIKGYSSLYNSYNLGKIEEEQKDTWLEPLINKKPHPLFRKITCNSRIINKLCNYVRFLIKRKPVIPNLEYMVTTVCNMRCKECNTRVPYFAPKNHVFATVDDFKSDMEKLLLAVDYVLALGLVGGEPCLSPHLPAMIRHACGLERVLNVFVPTNCTVPLSDDLLDALAHPKVTVQISDYREVCLGPGVVCRYDEYKEQFRRHQIRFSAFQEGLDSSGWGTTPEAWPDHQDEAALKKFYAGCWGHFCRVLCEGKLLPCVLATYMLKNLPLSPEIQETLVDVRAGDDPKELATKIIAFYSRPLDPFCHYCHWEKLRKTVRAEQLGEKLAPADAEP